MSLSDKTLVRGCVDVVCALEERGIVRLDALLPVTCFTGRLARFLNSLRTDARSRLLSHRLLEKFAARCGINVAAIEDLTDFLAKLGAGRIAEDGKFQVDIKDIETVYSISAKYWRRKLEGRVGTEDGAIVLLLDLVAVPSSLTSLRDSFSKTDLVGPLLQTLLELGLILHNKKLDVYFSPKYFGREDEPIATFLDRTKGASREFVKLIEEIQDCQGYPLDEVSPQLRTQTDAAIAAGILEAVGIVVGGRLSTYLFTPEPVEDKIYLSKETVAHFRYNERYADPFKGRLKEPVVFLQALINNGSAGAANNIATNYLALEEKGVVVARKGGISGLPMMVARKLDVLRDAKDLLQSPQPLPKASTYGSLADWIKNPVETRVSQAMPRLIDEKQRLDLVRMLRDEVR